MIPNFVDVRRFQPAPEAPRPGSLVFVGRLSREKNLEALVEAVAGVDGASLTLVGDGPLRAGLERRAEQLGATLASWGRCSTRSCRDPRGGRGVRAPVAL